VQYLFDTNTCIALMRNHPRVVHRTSSLSPHDIAVSSITIYELYTGVEKCANAARERAKVEKLLSFVQELPFGMDAAREAARIRALLESQGAMIGPYDVLLAGQALSAALILVTSDVSEFQRVPSLQIEDWRT
jgi:tRNA(fMet)-specific endonuclease VapC